MVKLCNGGRWLLGSVLALALAGPLAAFSAYPPATVRFTGAQIQVAPPSPGWFTPGYVAADGRGNFWVADTTSNNLWQVSPGGIAAEVVDHTLLPGTVTGILAVGVDGKGNVYTLMENGTGTSFDVIRAAPSPTGPYSVSTVVSQTVPAATPYMSMAVDAAGDLFLFQNNPAQLVEFTAASGYGSTQTTALPGLNGAYAMTVDSGGNLYLTAGTATGYALLKETPAGGGYSETPLASSTGPIPFLGVAVDGSGDAFYVDANVGELFEIQAGGTTPTAVAFGSGDPGFVAVNGQGDLCVTGPSLGARVINLQGARFPAVPVGSSTPPTLTLTFQVTGAGVLPVAPQVLTQGVAGLDFTDAGGAGSVSDLGQTHLYGSGDTATVTVQFSPTVPGTRNGALVLPSKAGISAPIATVYLAGTGTGPQLAFLPGTESTVSSVGFVHRGLAVDGQGTLYLADYSQTQVETGTTSVSTPLGGGNYLPYMVALDGAGNVYFTDLEHGVLVKATRASDGSFSMATLLDSTYLTSPFGVAVDAFGTIYVGDAGKNEVFQLTPSGGGYLAPVTVASAATNALAVDGNGILYLTRTSDDTVQALAPAGPQTVASLAGYPTGVAVDGHGVIYYCDVTGAVGRATPSGTGYAHSTLSLPSVNGSANGLPFGVAPDQFGNLYVIQGSTILKEDFSSGPSLTFDPTALGATSASQTVTVENLGDAELDFTGSNPSVVSGSGFSWSPDLPASLAAGSSADLTFTFQPIGAAGPFSEQVNLSGNALPATRQIALSGTAFQGPFNLTGTVVGTGTVGTAYGPFTFTASGGAPPYAFTVTGLPAGISQTTTATTVTLSGTPTQAGSYTVTITPSDSVSSQNPISFSLDIAKGTATITLGGLAPNYTGSPLAATVTTAPAGLTVSVTYNGSSTVPTFAGSYPVVATVMDQNYTGSASGNLVIGKATATLTLGGLAQTYTGSPLVATATTNPAGVAVTFAYDGGLIAPTAAGSYTVTAALNDPNYQDASATGTLVISKATAAVTLGGLTQTYTGSPLAATATTFPAGLAVNITYNGSATAPSAPGSYAVLATVADQNYTGSASGTLVISSATLPATITLGSLAQTYTGSPRAASASTSPAGLPVSLTYDGSATPPTAAGSYAVVATVNAPPYQGSATGTLVIAKATVTVTVSPLLATYSGNPNPPKVTTSAPVAGWTFTSAPELGGSAASGAPVDAGLYQVTATVADPNYQGSGSNQVAVLPRLATVTLSGLGKVALGHVHVTASTSPAGLPVKILFNGSTAVPTQPGTYQVTAAITNPDYLGAATGTLQITLH